MGRGRKGRARPGARRQRLAGASRGAGPLPAAEEGPGGVGSARRGCCGTAARRRTPCPGVSELPGWFSGAAGVLRLPRRCGVGSGVLPCPGAAGMAG